MPTTMPRSLVTNPPIDVRQVRMAIFWKVLDELDLYQNGQVYTVTGSKAQEMMLRLREENITVEVME